MDGKVMSAAVLVRCECFCWGSNNGIGTEAAGREGVPVESTAAMRIDRVNVVETTAVGNDRAIEMAFLCIFIGFEIEFLGIIDIEMGHENFESFVLER